ncbi:MAG: response regulator transcription factor [Bacteroidetes bacterium]|nr:response regulator transcription factor [Bacteroidota bacterium]
MINAIIIDDERHNRDILRTLLERYFSEIEVVAEAENAENAYKLLLEHKPNLVFLDVKMPGETGFDLLKRFKEIPFEVIFVTAYDQYAIHAFEFNAVGYILKPIDFTKLIQCVQKTILKIQSNQGEDVVYHFLQTLSEKNELMNKVSVHYQGRVIFISIADTVFIEAKDGYCELVLKDNRKYTSTKELKAFETALQSSNLFVRVNRSVIINTSFIRSYTKGDSCIITLNIDQSFEVSRRKKAEVLSVIKHLGL